MANRYSVEAVFKVLDRFTAPVSKMQNSIKRFTRRSTYNIKRLNKTVDQTISKFMTLGKRAAITLTAGLTTVGLATRSILSEFSKFEDVQTSFIPILGSLDAAKSMMQDISATAVTTPFQIEDLAQGAQILLSMGAATREDVIPTLRMLGDVAGGSVDKFNRLAINFAEIQGNGRAMTRDIRQFTTAGVPLLAELADMWGVNIQQAQDMVTNGQATGEEVTKALRRLTGEGGKFFRAMDLAAKTNTGLWSNLKENISLTAVAIGNEMAPVVKDILRDLIEWTGQIRELVKLHGKDIREAVTNAYKWFKDNISNILDAMASIWKWTKILVKAYIGLKLATLAWHGSLMLSRGSMIAWNLIAGITEVIMKRNIAVLFLSNKAMKAHAIGTKIATAAMWLWRKAVVAVTAVQAAWNVVMMANPIGLVIAAIAALVAAGVWLYKKWDVIKQFFIDLWDKLPSVFKWPIYIIKTAIEGLMIMGEWLMNAWEPIKQFFIDLWGGIVQIVTDAKNALLQLIKDMHEAIQKFMLSDLNPFKGVYQLGMVAGEQFLSGETEAQATSTQPTVVSPTEIIQKAIQETRSMSEVTLKTEDGVKADVTKGKLGNGVTLQKSGAF